jgi:hypothetical protein
MRVTGRPFPLGSTTVAGLVGGHVGHVDYYNIAMAPDRTPWVGFFQECPFGLPVQGNPNCPDTLTGAGTDGLWGMVGHLVRTHAQDDNE